MSKFSNSMGWRPSSAYGISAVFGDIAAACAGLSSRLILQVGGDVPFAEIFLFCALPPLLFVNRRNLRGAQFAKLMIFIACWLIGQILTDIYRQTPARDYTRGIANIVAIGIDIVALMALLSGNERRKATYFFFVAVGTILTTRFHPVQFSQAAPWKFGYSSGVSTLVALLSSIFFARRQYGMVIVFILAIAGVNLYENDRNVFLNQMMTVAFIALIAMERAGKLHSLQKRSAVVRLLMLMLMVGGAAGVSNLAVHWATNAGLLGDEAKSKNENQAKSPGGLLLGGRPEIVGSSAAVYDSPILGHGSWAKNSKYVELLADYQAKYGVNKESDPMDEDPEGLIPTHSHLMGAWVQAGVLGAIPWIYLWVLTVRALALLPSLRLSLTPMYCVSMMNFLFVIPFSPLGSSQRLGDAAVIVIVMDVISLTNCVGFARPDAGFKRSLSPSFN